MAVEQQTYQDDEITLKQLVLKVKEYFFEVLKNWWLVALICLPFLVYFLYHHYNFQSRYAATTRYIVEGSSNSGGISGLLGQFGIRRDSKTNPYKIMEVGRSANILRKVLFDKTSGDYIANRILEVYDFDAQWKEGPTPEMAGFRFKNAEVKKSDTTENLVLNMLFGRMVGSEENREEAIVSIDYNEESGVFSQTASTPDQQLSLDIMEQHYNAVKLFFEEEAVFAQASTVKILKQKADSLQYLINAKAYAAAGIQDRSLGLLSATPAVRGERLQREVAALSTALGEVLRSYEIADINLKDIKPTFLQIDSSLPPLNASRSSLLKSLFKACLFGGVLAVIFIIGRSALREALS